jgi:hypothetical protein
MTGEKVQVVFKAKIEMRKWRGHETGHGCEIQEM